MCLIKKERKKKFLYCYNQVASKTFAIADSIIFNGCYLHPVSQTKKSSLDMEEALAKAVSHIVLETDILAIKDECKMCMTEKDSNLPAFNSDTRVDHYWRSIFEIKTVCKNSKHIKLL